jgi:apolipoprotein N-acyltransferase
MSGDSVLLYGRMTLQEIRTPSSARAGVHRALIQDSFDTVFEFDIQREREVFASYLQLSRDAVLKDPKLDLIVWPESVYSGALGEVLVDQPLVVPPERRFPSSSFATRSKPGKSQSTRRTETWPGT